MAGLPAGQEENSQPSDTTVGVPSNELVPELLSAGAEIKAFSPAAVKLLKKVLMLISAHPSSLVITILAAEAARGKIIGEKRILAAAATTCANGNLDAEDKRFTNDKKRPCLYI